MENIDIEELKIRWSALQSGLEKQFDEKPDLQTILFLIGVQELGKGIQKYSKEEKLDLMHIAVCKLLSSYGYYQFENYDEQGWPHYKLSAQMPPLSMKEQDILLKQAVIKYFEEQ